MHTRRHDRSLGRKTLAPASDERCRGAPQSAASPATAGMFMRLFGLTASPLIGHVAKITHELATEPLERWHHDGLKLGLRLEMEQGVPCQNRVESSYCLNTRLTDPDALLEGVAEQYLLTLLDRRQDGTRQSRLISKVDCSGLDDPSVVQKRLHRLRAFRVSTLLVLLLSVQRARDKGCEQAHISATDAKNKISLEGVRRRAQAQADHDNGNCRKYGGEN